MKKLIILLGILMLAGLVSGCATPQLKVPESEIPKLNKIFLEGEEYAKVKEVEVDGKLAVVYSEPKKKELVIILKNSLAQELSKRGFVITDKPEDDVLIAKFKIAFVSYTIPPGGGGVVVHLFIFHQSKLIMEYQGTAFTSLLFSEKWVIKNKIAPGFARIITKYFNAGE